MIDSRLAAFDFYFDKKMVNDTLLAEEILEEFVTLTQSVLFRVVFLDIC